MSLLLHSMSDLEPTVDARVNGCRVLEINDFQELANFRLAWDALLAQSPQSNYFQTLDWLTSYFRHQGRECRLRALVVQAYRKTIGFMPLVVRSETSRVGSLRVLTYPLHDWGTFYGPIGPNVTATLLAGLGHIRRTPRDWDVLDLRWIDEDTADRGRTARALTVQGFPPLRDTWSTAAIIDLEQAGNWDRYWASRTTKWRTNVRRNERRLAELGDVRYVRYRPRGIAFDDGAPRWDLYSTCEAIAGRSWQAQSTTGTTITHDTVRDFLRDAHESAARAGGVDLNLLYLNDKPIAFNYGYHFRGQVFGLRMGFDRSSGADGAGTVLLYRTIQDSFARGDRIFDLGADYLDCKRVWLTRLVPSYRLSHYPPGFSRAQLIHAKRWVTGFFKTTCEAHY